MSATQVMEDWFEQVWNKGNTEHIDRHLSDNCNISGLGDSKINSVSEFRAFHANLFQGLSSFDCKVLRTVENGDDVAGYVSVSATHRKTGKVVEFHTSFIATVREGKIYNVQNTVNFFGRAHPD
ncbi:MAG: ester cyclase [Alphaproteobacteria bacterium]|nr:ester cyclase [Alphaproteobacteria bacterium]